MQPRLLDGHVLERVDLRRVGEAEDAADPLLRVGVGHLVVGQELDLLELLLERHPAEQPVDPLLDVLVGGLARRRQGVAAAGGGHGAGDHGCASRGGEGERESARPPRSTSGHAVLLHS